MRRHDERMQPPQVLAIAAAVMLAVGCSTVERSRDIGNPAVSGNLAGAPGTNGTIAEVFWTPIQWLRIGAQYWAYNRFNGASGNYDGFGRNARDNNTLFVYVWGAY